MALGISEADIAKIVQNVMAAMPEKSKPAAPQKGNWDSTQYEGRKLIGIYSDMNEAIIAASAGYKAVREMTVEQRECIISHIRGKSQQKDKSFM